MTIDEMLDSKPAALAAVARRLRAIVREELPDADESIYGGKAVQTVLYSIGGTNNVVCGFQPSDKGYCFFYLHHVMPEESEVLKLEGQDGGNRHVKLRELAAKDKKEVRRLIRLAKSRAS
jgi:hypothetical protein